MRGKSGSVIIDENAAIDPLPPIADAVATMVAVSAPIAVEAPAEAPVPAEPTAPRAMTPDGFELDEWDLPRAGPIRVALLAQLKRTDPNDDPTGWERTPAPAALKE